MTQSTKFTALIALLIVNCLCLTAQTLPTSGIERNNGLQKRKLQQADTLLQHIKFRNIGPTAMSGRVVDIEVNPADPTEFYLAFASGGLWHTTNNGQSFSPIFDREDVITIGDIAVNWTSRTIWVGTGEVNSSRSSYAGNGVYKSSDNGKNWSYLGLPESHHIGEIILHPTNNDIAWVAAMGHLYSPNKERGVYKTTDGGKTWKQTLFIDENTGAVEMDINPKNPDELYASMWYRSRRAWDWVECGSTSGIYKSTDGGNKWQLITTANSGFPTGAKIGRSGVSIFAGNPNIVYAVVDNNNIKPASEPTKKTDSTKYTTNDFKTISKEAFLGLSDKKLDSFMQANRFPSKYNATKVKELVRTDKLKPTVLYDWLIADDGFQNAGIYGCEIYRSDDAGRSWRKVNTKDINVYSTYGYYFGKIVVSPTNENKVITYGVNMVMSDDGGKTFKSVDKDNTHADWHHCWINPNRDSHWIGANDGGANITYDNGDHWFKVTSVPVGQFYGITVDEAKPYNVYGGLQDNGIWYGPSKTSMGNDFSFPDNKKDPDPEDYAWKVLGGGDGMQVQIDTRDNKTAYYGSQFGFYQRRSTDGGRSQSIHPMHDLGEPKLRYNWQTPILLSKHQQDIFYFGSNKLHKSLNKAETLETMSGDLTGGKKEGKIPYGTLTTLSESPLRMGLLYTGSDDGYIYVTKDGGYSWTNISQNLPKNVQGLWVSRVAASKFKEGRLYITLNGYRFDNFMPYLFVSNDYGATWTALGSNLPPEPLNVVKEDAKQEDIIYVGSDNGLYASFNMGKTFMDMGRNLPRVPVHDLVIQERENELVVGTHGRSIFITKLDAVQKVYEGKR